MNLFQSTIYFLAIGFSICHIYPESQDDYFMIPISNKHVVSVIFDSKKNPYSKKMVDRLLGDLEKLEAAKTKDIKFVSVEISKIPMLKNHYSIETPFVFYYYIQNRLHRFGEFNELANQFLDQTLLYTDFLEKVSGFLKSRVDRICHPISSIGEYQTLLEKIKIFGIFIGKSEGFFFDQYYEFAEKNTDFNFFYAKDDFVSDVIYYHHLNLPRPQNEIYFGIARDNSLLTELDTKSLVMIDARKTMGELGLFYEFEKYPKLRGSSSGDDSFFRIFNKNEKLILYVRNKQSREEDLKEFKRAVYLLPKLFIFTEISVDDPEWGSFMQMFIHGGENPMENRVYIIAAPFGQLKIQMIPSQIIADKLIEGIQRYYQQNRGAFSELERQVFDGPENPPTPEYQDELLEPNQTNEEYVYQEL